MEQLGGTSGSRQSLQTLLGRVDIDQLTHFLKKVTEHQTKTFRFEDQDEEKDLFELKEKWRALQTWFLGDSWHESEYELLELRTNESMRRMTRVMQRLSECHHQFRSRKKDYLHLAEWFAGMTDVEEAHELSAVAFGVFHTRHYHTNHVPTDDIYTDVWEESPMSHETRPRITDPRV